MTMQLSLSRSFALVLVAATLAACTVGPDYQRPPMPTPPAYKEGDGWKPSEPQDAALRGPWWQLYGDPALDQLEQQVAISNQNLKAAEAAFRQAIAIVGEARAGYWPTVTGNGSVTRSGGGGSSKRGGGNVFTSYDISAAASWEIDLWGRIRRTVESDVANAQASAGDLAAARLSAQTALATDYFGLRIADELQRLLDATVEAFAKSLEIARNRYASGVAAKSDVVSAQAQLEQTRAQAINVGVQRAQFEHAIAVLIGKAPAEFSIAPTPLTAGLPAIPPGVPSTLLERRPDVAAAERRMAAANAQIGIAIAAYFPTISLTGSYGYSSTAFSTLLETANRVWALGPQLAATLFDGGLRSAQVQAARAGYDQTVAAYRQTVLTGFQQVEDNLATLAILARQAEVQEVAVRDAQEAERLTLNQYKAGTVAYTSVITAQATTLSNEQTSLSILQSRLVASVSLIGALGGGWEAADLPTGDRLSSDAAPPVEKAGQR